MKKSIVVPAICFAVLSTPAFNKVVHAATNTTSSKQTASMATTTKYVNVEKGSSLFLRSMDSATSSILDRLSRGTSVTVISTSGSWANVKVDGEFGFVSTKYLTSTKLSSNIIKTALKYVNVHVDSSLLLREKASTNSAILSRLERGTSVRVLSNSGTWSKVSVGGKTGYVHSEYLSSSKVTTISTTSVTTPTKYVAVKENSSLLFRQNPSTSSAILSRLKRGTSVHVISTSGAWSKVTVGGLTGYVHAEYLSATKVTSTETVVSSTATQIATTSASSKTVKKYVNVSSGSRLNFRKKPSTKASVIATFSSGAVVQVLSEANGWSKVSVSGKTGYVSAKYLSTTSPASSNKTAAGTGTTGNGGTSSNTTTVQKNVSVSPGSRLNMRTAPSTTASVITQLSAGTTVQVLSNTSGWSKVSVSGKTGYVSSSYLSPAKDNSAPALSTSTGSTNSGTTNTGTTNTGSSDSGTTNTGTNNTGTSDNGTSSSNTTAPTVQMYVSVSAGSSLNMRTAPATTASVITQLSNGTVVQILSEANGWAQVSANGKTGYVSSNYLTATVNNASNVSISKSYESYSISLNNMESLEQSTTPQTDKKYSTYIRSDALIVDNQAAPSKGLVFGSDWNIRGGAGTNFWVVGQVSNGSMVQILSSVKGTDGNTWYQISYDKTWVNASPDDVAYYLNPSNFTNDPVQMFQFLKLSETAKVDPDEVNQKILAGKGTLAGQAQSFITAGNTYGINELYLIAHALLETGNGTSELATGVQYKDKIVYNMYGIGAYDDSPIDSGAAYAYNAGWFTPEAAIIGGAQFIDSNYIEQGQDTLYKMKWDPSGAASANRTPHQYATDIGWAYKQVSQLYNLYHLINSYQIKLDIPEYLK